MHKRIVYAVSALLFALLAVVVGIVVDLHDRSYPERLGAVSAVKLDFAKSPMPHDEAFRELGAHSDRLRLGLVKVAPDLSGDQSGQIFIAVGSAEGLPERFEWYGDQPPGKVVGKSALEHSYPSGAYLVTGDRARLPELTRYFQERGVLVERHDDGPGQTLAFVVRQGSFVTTLVSAAALLVALALYWLSVKARARALRVLGGAPAWRIQVQDLGAFLVALVCSAVLCTAVASVYVGLVHGWAFVPYYAQTLALFDTLVILATMSCALAMSAVSWPSTTMLARRQPAAKSLRKVSAVLKAATFVLVIAAIGPAWAAYTDAAAAAEQQAQWKALADQVALSFPSVDEAKFQTIKGDVGDVVKAGQQADQVALSYTFTQEQVEGFDLGKEGAVALVNQRWLDLMLKKAPTDALVPISRSDVPAGMVDFLGPTLELNARGGAKADEMLDGFEWFRVSGSAEVPFAASGGDLMFLDEAVVALVPDPHATFDDDFLASVTSSSNLVFTGLGETTELLEAHGLEHTLAVKFIAEEGVLRAQMAAYTKWLRSVSLVGLLVSLTVAASISAYITAMLRARRDFPMRLAGQPWARVLATRVSWEWAVGLGLAAAVVLLQRPDTIGVVLLATFAALALAPLAHVAAARWCFVNLSMRRL